MKQKKKEKKRKEEKKEEKKKKKKLLMIICITMEEIIRLIWVDKVMDTINIILLIFPIFSDVIKVANNFELI